MKKILILPLITGMIALPSVARAQGVVIESQDEDMEMSMEERRQNWKLMSPEEKQMRREQLREERRQRKESRKAIEEDDVFVDVSEEEAAGLVVIEEEEPAAGIEAEIGELMLEEPPIEDVIVIEQPTAQPVIKSQGNWNRPKRPRYND